MLTKFIHSHTTTIILLFSLVITALLHGYNMFNYPYFENDEGTYLSQAYAVAYENRISHYTYWYDHVPLGWVFLAGWLRLTGGPFAFGFSLNSARVFMWLLQIGSSYFIFSIVKKLTKNNLVAFLGVILFSASPLAIYFHRRLLLDNIMTFWMLASLFVLIRAGKRLSHVIMSGLLLSLAILTKENAVFAIPGYLWLIHLLVDRRQRFLSWILFLMPVVIGLTYFIFFALLKGELLPGDGHVSLIGTWAFHLGRGSSDPFWSPTSDFYGAFRDWLGKDAFIIISTIVASTWILLKPTQDYLQKALILIGVMLWLFVLRGGLVINFYVVPLLAFGAIAIAFTINDLLKVKHLGLVSAILIIIMWVSTQNGKVWSVNETQAQLEATEWIKQNLSPETVIAVDHSHLIDLQQSRFKGDPAFKNAQWFWKLDRDPQVQAEVLYNDWKNIEYFALTHEYLKQIKEYNLPYIAPMYDYSTTINQWGPYSSDTHINLEKKISTNGDWVKIFRRYDYIETLLADSWTQYKKNFITPEGKVIDPQTNKTTSEGQSYALIRSVIANDPTTFAVVLNWTTSHLQNRQSDSLFSWWWGDLDDGSEGIIDAGWASDADIDIATALILASRKWHIPEYKELAEIIVTDIWDETVFEIDGTYYLLAGNWAQYGDAITVNPSYYSPAAYRLFAEIDADTEHDWETLISDSYSQLNQMRKLSDVNLVPDWVAVNKETQSVSVSNKPNLSKIYGYDAMRIPWRISQDYLWFKTPEAHNFIETQTFLQRQWQNGGIKAGYTLAGVPTNNYSDNSFYGAWLPAARILDESEYQQIFDQLKSSQSNSVWEPADNYYTQNWTFLGVALAENKYKYVAGKYE